MNFKTILNIIGILLFLSCTSSSKLESNNFFEGRIIYKNEFIFKTNEIDTNSIIKFFGKTADLYFKEGNYVEKYDDGDMLEQLYRKQDNKIYIKRNQSDTLFWMNCGRPGKSILRFELNPTKETILGIVCDELITYYENKTVSFYFNSDTLKINPDWYSTFTLTNKNINTQKMKSIYLKYKIEYPNFIASVIATSISQQMLDSRLFTIPKNKILVEDK
jgi:hypothetical protein